MLLLLTFFFSFLLTTPHEVAAAGTEFLTGSKTLEITDYSVLKKSMSKDDYIRSDNFTVGGYQWAILFYPQGRSATPTDDYISIFVRLINPRNYDKVKAIFTFRLLDWKTSTWSTITPWYYKVEYFSSYNTDRGNFIFMYHPELEKSSYLRNDTLLIKTTLWVAQNTSSTSTSTVARHLYGWWHKFFPTGSAAAVSFDQNSKSADV